MNDNKRLYRSEKDRVIAGVCGGLSEYLDIDPTLIRLGLVFATFLGGAGALAYLVAAIVIPVQPYPAGQTVVEVDVDVAETTEE